MHRPGFQVALHCMHSSGRCSVQVNLFDILRIAYGAYPPFIGVVTSFFKKSVVFKFHQLWLFMSSAWWKLYNESKR